MLTSDPTRRVRFAQAPELASIAILEATATAVREALFSCNPSLSDFVTMHPSKEDLTSLIARLMVNRLDELAGVIDWYRTAVAREHDEDIPF